MHIPDGYQPVMPYLIIQDAGAFLEYMKKVFGAAEKMKVMRDAHYIMHGELQINGHTIMFANATEDYPVMNAGIFIYVDNADAAYDRALAEGSISVLELRDQDYGRTCGVRDPFGNTWWITSMPAS